MKIKYGDLKQLIQEEREYSQVLQELFGKKQDFDGALDAILMGLQDLNKKVEAAHGLAPGGAAKAIVTGIHSDIFNKAAEVRKYVEQLKSLAKKAQGQQQPQQPMKKAA
jgi:hypothetical protein